MHVGFERKRWGGRRCTASASAMMSTVAAGRMILGLPWTAADRLASSSPRRRPRALLRTSGGGHSSPPPPPPPRDLEPAAVCQPAFVVPRSILEPSPSP